MVQAIKNKRIAAVQIASRATTAYTICEDGYYQPRADVRVVQFNSALQRAGAFILPNSMPQNGCTTVAVGN